MAGNSGQWIQEERIQLLCAFLREQEVLKEFHFRENFLTSECSEKLLTAIAQTAKLCKQLKKLHLSRSLNFESDASVDQFAEILLNASKLEYCNIQAQQGARKIEVEQESTEIKILDKETEELICTRQSVRNKNIRIV